MMIWPLLAGVGVAIVAVVAAGAPIVDRASASLPDHTLVAHPHAWSLYPWGLVRDVVVLIDPSLSERDRRRQVRAVTWWLPVLTVLFQIVALAVMAWVSIAVSDLQIPWVARFAVLLLVLALVGVELEGEGLCARLASELLQRFVPSQGRLTIGRARPSGVPVPDQRATELQFALLTRCRRGELTRRDPQRLWTEQSRGTCALACSVAQLQHAPAATTTADLD